MRFDRQEIKKRGDAFLTAKPRWLNMTIRNSEWEDILRRWDHVSGPTTVLSLISEIEALEEELALKREENQRMLEELEGVKAQVKKWERHTEEALQRRALGLVSKDYERLG
jgi:DNA repair exonuclease SbcCD nuclease subunit